MAKKSKGTLRLKSGLTAKGVRLGVAALKPLTSYFTTPHPDVFIAVDYNEATGAYDLNPREIPRADVPHVFFATHGSGPGRDE